MSRAAALVCDDRTTYGCTGWLPLVVTEDRWERLLDDARTRGWTIGDDGHDRCPECTRVGHGRELAEQLRRAMEQAPLITAESFHRHFQAGGRT